MHGIFFLTGIVREHLAWMLAYANTLFGFHKNLHVALNTVSSSFSITVFSFFSVFSFFLLLKVYFPNCQRKRTQKECKWGHSKLIYPFSFPMAYLWTDCDRGPDTESWFMISLASDVLPCCHCVQRDCASQKWSMSIALGRSGPKLRLPENFLNYSALTITFWTLLKELSLLSLLPSPLDNMNHELLSLFTCTNKKQSTNLYVGIHCVREHAWERLTLDKGAFTVNFLQAFFSA